MTRTHLPHLASGTLLRNSDTFQAFHIIEALTGSLLSASLGWTVADIINSTPATYDVVLHSTGTLNDVDVWFRATATATQVVFNVYQDWSISGSGAGTGSAATGQSFGSVDGRTGVRWWSATDGYEVAMVISQAGSWQVMMAGNPMRPYPSGFDGVARLAVTTTASVGTTTLQLDRNISGTLLQTGSIQPRQVLWIYPQTIDSQALVSRRIDIVTCSVVDPSGMTLNVTGTTRTFPSGSLVGLRPSQCYVGAAAGTLSTLYLNHTISGTYTAADTHNASAYPTGISFTSLQGMNPDYTNLYGVADAIIVESDTNFNVPLGYSNTTAHCSKGNLPGVSVVRTSDVYWLAFDGLTLYVPNMALGPFPWPIPGGV